MNEPQREALELITALEAEVMRQQNAALANEDLHRVIAGLREDVASERRRVDRAEAEAVKLRGLLEGVLSSASWQVTRPLRVLRGAQRPEAHD